MKVHICCIVFTTSFTNFGALVIAKNNFLIFIICICGQATENLRLPAYCSSPHLSFSACFIAGRELRRLRRGAAKGAHSACKSADDDTLCARNRLATSQA